MPLSLAKLRGEEEEQAAGAFVLVGYKETDQDGFEDGTTHVFGIYDDEETAMGEAERLLAVQEWHFQALPIRQAPST